MGIYLQVLKIGCRADEVQRDIRLIIIIQHSNFQVYLSDLITFTFNQILIRNQFWKKKQINRIANAWRWTKF